MVAYGDDAVILQMLGPDEPNAGFQAEFEARVTAMNETVSRLIDDELGRSFGTTGLASQRIVEVLPKTGVVILPVPARTVTEIAYGFTNAGGVISGGTALTTDQWSTVRTAEDGTILALQLGSSDYVSYFTQLVAITAMWADEGSDTTVPSEIQWAANYIVAERMKQEQASPAGFVGQDGTVTPIRNPWSDPQVRRVLDTYRLVTKGLVL